MRHHGLGDNIVVVDGAFTSEGGAKAMRSILGSPDMPTAIVAPNDFAAIGVLDVADGAGIAVPGDLSVTGYDNISMARMGRIDLTTIAQPTIELGKTAVQLLREKIEEGRTETRHIVLTPSLVVGGTTGPLVG